MPESTNITLPKTMSITKRISEANKHISKWIKSLETPFDDDKDDIRLIKCEMADEKFSYHYRVDREIKAAKRNR